MAESGSPQESVFAPFEELSRRAKSVEGALTTLVAVAATVGGLIQQKPVVSGVAVAVFLGAVGWALWKGRRRAPPPPITIFPGATPFSERDRDRFFGRDQEIGDLVEKLALPDISYLLLFGEAGSGKTSLIRAGVIPRIEAGGTMASAYVRLYNQPLKFLREALRRVAPGAQATAPATATQAANPETAAATPSLVEEFTAAQARVGKPLVVFIDQFEEFFVHARASEEFREVRALVAAILGDPAKGKLVLSLRRDFLYRVDIFDDCVDDILQKKSRYPLHTLTRSAAQQVIVRSLKAQGGTPWSDGLIARVLDDLAIRSDEAHAADGTIVLPAELQIVCQMVQRWNLFDARTYPGKRKLIQAYVRSAIEQAPTTSAEAVQTLLALTHENKLTRAEPQTPAQVATRAGVPEKTVRVFLRRFEEEHRLITSVAPQTASSTDGAEGSASQGAQVQYELSHEYLVPIIFEIAGTVRTPAMRSRALLETYRARAAVTPGLRMPIGDCLYVRRHFPGVLTPEDRVALSRSVRGFALVSSIAIALPLSIVLACRYTTVHLDFHRVAGENHVVVKRGLPFLPPLLGSDAVLIDSGYSEDDLDEAGLAACWSKRWFVDVGPYSGRWESGNLVQWVIDAAIAELKNKPYSSKIERIGKTMAALRPVEERVIHAYRDRVDGDLKEIADCHNGQSCLETIVKVRHMEDTAKGLGMLSPADPATMAKLFRPLPMFLKEDPAPVEGGVAKTVALAVAIAPGADPPLIAELLQDTAKNSGDLLLLHQTPPAVLDYVDTLCNGPLITSEEGLSFRPEIVSLLGTLNQAKLRNPRIDAALATLFRAAAPKLALFKHDLFASAHWRTLMRLIADGGFDKKEIARAVVDGMRGSDVESADNSKVARRGVGLRESDDPVLAMLDVLAPENPLGDEARQLLIERARREPSDSDCDVEAVALKLRIRDALLDSRTEECVDRLARWVLPAYGEFRLLHEGEKFDEAVDRLIQELASPRAEASIGYRVAIEHALIALAGKQDQKSRDTLRVRIESLRQSRSARRRRSANQILDDWPHQEASPAG